MKLNNAHTCIIVVNMRPDILLHRHVTLTLHFASIEDLGGGGGTGKYFCRVPVIKKVNDQALMQFDLDI